MRKNVLHIYTERVDLQIDDDESSTMMEATVNQYHVAIEQIIKKKAVVGTITHLLKVCVMLFL